MLFLANGVLLVLSFHVQVTAVAFGGRDDTVIAGGLDNCAHVFDLRNLAEIFKLEGHTGEHRLVM